MFDYNLSAIESARHCITIRPDKRRALFIAEKIRLDFVFNTAALEGNPFTFPEVQTLLDGITVGGHKISDSNQILNLNKAHTHMLTAVKREIFTLSAAMACQLNAIVAFEEALKWGEFRDAMVTIAGTEYRPPPAHHLADIFESGKNSLAHILDPILRALLTFLWGSLNQFFYDGNKRTSRLLSNGILLMAGYPPLLIKAQDQLHYNQIMTRFYDTQEGTQALLWFYGYYQAQVANLGFEARE